MQHFFRFVCILRNLLRNLIADKQRSQLVMVFLLQRIKIRKHQIKQSLVDSICKQIHNDSLKFAVKAVKQVIDLVDQFCSGVSRGIACPSFRFSECRTEIQAKGSIHCHGSIVQHSNEIRPNVHDC